MILFNTTVSLDSSIASKWVEWAKSYYIPKVIKTGYVVECRLCKIRGNEPLEITYSIQIIYENDEVMDNFNKNERDNLNTEMNRLFGGRFAHFNTILEIVHSQV